VNRDEIVEKIRDYFRGSPRGIVAVYLFGSLARGEQGVRSDVDIGVVTGGRPQRLEDELYLESGDLEAMLGLPVDLVAMDDAPPDLVHRVLRDGILVLENDRGRRIAFEVQARNAYFDLERVLESYRRTRLGSI
jgi:predicted nucleotidyltransferase